MANCITCGRRLPTFTFGERHDVCGQCRASSVNMPTGYSPPPEYSHQTAGRVVVARRRAPVTTVLIGLNLAVFSAMALSGVSLSTPTIRQLLNWGANFGPLSLGPEPWRMLTSNYLHIGFLHILFNMWCLWDLGQLAERIFDGLTYVLTYTVCGLAGSLASLWWHPLVIGAGASGAIFGLAGALIAALYLGHFSIPKQAVQHTLRSLMIFAGYNLFFGAVGSGIDNSAHMGGLISGLILGAVLAKHLAEPEEVRKRWRSGVFAAAAILLFAIFTWVKQANGHFTFPEQGRLRPATTWYKQA